MKKKIKIVIISILFIVLAMTSYILIGKIFLKNKMNEYLKEKGYTTNEIAKVKVRYSLVSYILSYGAWGISVEYTDESEILYFYKYKNNKIVSSGVGGSPKAEKEDLKHLIHPIEEKRYAEIYNSLEKSFNNYIDATFVIRNEYNCKNYALGFITSTELIENVGLLKQVDMLDIDGTSYCKGTIISHATEYDGNSCDVEYDIYIKCNGYEMPGYMEHPDALLSIYN